MRDINLFKAGKCGGPMEMEVRCTQLGWCGEALSSALLRHAAVMHCRL